MPFRDLMVDLETVDNSPTSAIISIGAVFFDVETQALGKKFYSIVDLDSSLELGGTVSAGTLRFWMSQGEEAKEVFKNGRDIRVVMEYFARFVNPDPTIDNPVRVWGNGASFDNAILKVTYDRLKLPLPWEFWNDRCYRTLKNQAPDIKLEREGTYHNALDDAISQAKHLMQLAKEGKVCVQ